MNLKYSSACLTKATLTLALLAFALFNVSGQFAAQEPKSRTFTYRLTGEAWLSVLRVNRAEDSDWNPSFTTIETSYRPVVTKHGDQWEVTFRSPTLPSPDLP